MVALEAQSEHVGPGEGDGGFRNQAASERNLADQLARDGAKAEGAGDDGGDLGFLLAVSDLAVAGGRDQERHPDLIHGEEGGVAGELADGPGQLDQVGNDVRKGGRQGEERVLAGDGEHDLVDDWAAEGEEVTRERQSELVAGGENLAHGPVRGVGVKREGVLRRRELLIVEDQVEAVGNARIAGAVEHREHDGAPLARNFAGRGEELLHRDIAGRSGRDQADFQTPLGCFADLVGAKIG